MMSRLILFYIAIVDSSFCQKLLKIKRKGGGCREKLQRYKGMKIDVYREFLFLRCQNLKEKEMLK